MDYQELLFAAEVRRIALAKKQNARISFQDANPDSDLTQWEKENQDPNFLKIALAEVIDIAEFIRQNAPTNFPHQMPQSDG